MQLSLIFLAILSICQARDIPGYDGEASNYGNIKGAADRFKKQNGMDTTVGNDANQDIFYFFSLHDYNKDHHLDGHELGMAFLGYEFHQQEQISMSDGIRQEDLEYMIDHALLEDDKNNDGKLSWEEYLESQNYHHNLKT